MQPIWDIHHESSLHLGIVRTLKGTSNRDDTESVIDTLALCPHTVNLIYDPLINIEGGLVRQ